MLNQLQTTGGWVCLFLLFTVSGCGTGQKDDAPEGETLQMPASPKGEAKEEPSRHYPVRIEVGWYDRTDPRLNRALAMLQPPPLAAREAGVWREHGFHIGTLDLERAALFLGNLPTPIEGKRYTIRRAEIHSALPLHTNTGSETRVQTLDDSGTSHTQRLMPGTYQLLTQIGPSPQPYAVKLDLIPHYYTAVQGTTQRDPQQPNVDGVSFMRLNIQPTLNATQVWVISVQPPSLIAQPTGTLGLAEAMLTRHARNHSLQGLVFIVLEAEPEKP